MNWKNKLKELEDSELWDDAVEFVQDVIKNNPNDVDAYIAINFLLMNILTYVHDYNQTTLIHYTELIKHYFDESYAKFNNSAEYLFFTAMTGYFSEWYFGLEIEDLSRMLGKALHIDPENLLYKWGCSNTYSDKSIYAKQIMQKDSPYRKILEEKGSMGEYLLDIMEALVKKADKELLDECK